MNAQNNVGILGVQKSLTDRIAELEAKVAQLERLVGSPRPTQMVNNPNLVQSVVGQGPFGQVG